MSGAGGGSPADRHASPKRRPSSDASPWAKPIAPEYTIRNICQGWHFQIPQDLQPRRLGVRQDCGGAGFRLAGLPTPATLNETHRPGGQLPPWECKVRRSCFYNTSTYFLPRATRAARASRASRVIPGRPRRRRAANPGHPERNPSPWRPAPALGMQGPQIMFLQYFHILFSQGDQGGQGVQGDPRATRAAPKRV